MPTATTTSRRSPPRELPNRLARTAAARAFANGALNGARLAVSYPGQTALVNVTVSAQNAVPKASLPLANRASALGTYEIALNPADLARKDAIEELTVVMEYRFTPA